jgi:hypothetical protein
MAHSKKKTKKMLAIRTVGYSRNSRCSAEHISATMVRTTSKEKPLSKQQTLFAYWAKPNKSIEDDRNPTKKARIDGNHQELKSNDETSSIIIAVEQQCKVQPQKNVDTQKARVAVSPVMNPQTEAKHAADINRMVFQVSEKSKDVPSSIPSPNNVHTNAAEADDSLPNSSESESDNDNGEHFSSNPDGLSDYELLRLRNIARNNARLQELGLLSNPTTESTLGGTIKQRRKSTNTKRKSRPKAMATCQQPMRRSTRLLRDATKMQGPILDDKENVTVAQGGNHANVNLVIEEEEDYKECFEVSPVVQYAMKHSHNNPTASSSSSDSDSSLEEITSLSLIGKRLQGLGGDVYTMQFYSNVLHDDATSTSTTRLDNNWLVGAGKSGMVALWDCNTAPQDDNGIEPVLSWKAHGGRWIAEAQFLPEKSLSSSLSSARLVTSANDGTVCLWDLSKVSSQTGVPKLLGQTGKELHKSGIFSMNVTSDSKATLVATGSKDKTICVSTLQEDSFSYKATWRSEFHTAKVSAVQFKSQHHLLASASDDGLVAVHDYRVYGKPVAVLDGAHDRPHSVVWEPSTRQHMLLTGEFCY